MHDRPLACRTATRRRIEVGGLALSLLALIVRGERSPVLPREMAERLREAIPAARLVEVPEAYHHVTLDRPEAFAATLRDALAAIP